MSAGIAGIHQRSSWHSTLLTADLLAPFDLRPVLPASATGRYSRDYYGASAPPPAISRRRACPPAGWLPAGRAAGDGSHVHCSPVREGGARLCPGSIASGTPQAFPLASPPARPNRLRS